MTAKNETRNSDTTTAAGFELRWQNKETFLSLITVQDALTLSPKGRLEFYKNMTSLVRDRIQEVMTLGTKGVSYGKMPFMVPEFSEHNSISDDEIPYIIVWRDSTLAFCNECQELQEAEEGKEFYQMTRKLKIGGQFELSKGQLKGYNTARGEWNNFNPKLINECIDFVDNILPRIKFAQNNPNNGRVQHKWITSGDYVTVKFSSISGKLADEINQLFFSQIESKFEITCKADSCRIEKEDTGNPYLNEKRHNIELIFWWD